MKDVELGSSRTAEREVGAPPDLTKTPSRPQSRGPIRAAATESRVVLSSSKDTDGSETSNVDHDPPPQGCCSLAFRELFLGTCEEYDAGGKLLDVDASFSVNAKGCILASKMTGWLLTASAIAARLATVDRPGFYLVAYLSQWGLVVSLFYQTLSALLSSGLCRFGPSIGHCFVVRMAWVFFSVATGIEMLVTVVYWTFNYQPGYDDTPSYPIIMAHGIVLLILLIDGLILNRIPVRIRHWIYTGGVLGIFAAWTAYHAYHIHRTPEGQDGVLYAFLDWKESKNEALTTTLIMLLLLSPLFHLIILLFSMFRRRYREKDEDLDCCTAPNGECRRSSKARDIDA